jgi:2-oxoglutarate dehydrogenase E1 component
MPTPPKKSMQDLWQDSYLASGNEHYLEELYESYLTNPQSVSHEWRQYFDSLFQNAKRPSPDISHAALREEFAQMGNGPSSKDAKAGLSPHYVKNQERVIELIDAYRCLGHLQADIDPLGLMKPVDNPTLTLSYYGFTEKDLNSTFDLGSYFGLGESKATLNDLFQSLRHVYCSSIGFEYMQMTNNQEIDWARKRIEEDWANFNPTTEEKKRILDRLIVADGLEKYLGFKYVGQKRFSLEGGDSLVPLLDTIVNRGVESGTKEVIIGMAHRGRLNVLVNIVGKAPKAIFAAFEGKGVAMTHSGDVKYHLGYSSLVKTKYGVVHIVLAFNPSHLEIVSPVVQGSVRARQRRRKDKMQTEVLPIQIHGDAAFAGQGVVMETFNLSQTRWFKVGGSIHIVINNQVGFTISNPEDARSTRYCTDIAKMVEAPILHVNGNDPEAVYFAALFAIDFRQVFKKDVVIDLVCYRRQGHNEADEPSATQPVMYKIIKSMPPPYVTYAKKLIDEGIIDDQTEKNAVDNYRNELDAGDPVVKIGDQKDLEFSVDWGPFVDKHWNEKTSTAVPIDRLMTLAKNLEVLPEGFTVQPQVKKTLEARKEMTEGKLPINWGYAETLAYATLLAEGYPIRLCGQDSGRGTFAHRHAILHDQNTDEIYVPLSHVAENQAQINIVDSLLSEEAVLAFEYGYSTAEPNFLVLWEAQFGDFANGAQVVIDQFISSGEQKWGRLCGLVMLLPHGYEGMGPEHSSARLERYLQLCAQDNMQVCVPSTPAQIFHLLRRQMVRPYRKPLIVMSPKSLLRHPLAVSNLEDLAKGSFQLVVPEIDHLNAKEVDRVVFCSGKIYYELLEQRREKKIKNIALIRIEQLYPFPEEACRKIFKPYQHVEDIVWCQEEPQNQGAWATIAPDLRSLLAKGQKLRYIGRPSSASPAVGYHSVHEKEQEEIVKQSLMK